MRQSPCVYDAIKGNETVSEDVKEKCLVANALAGKIMQCLIATSKQKSHDASAPPSIAAQFMQIEKSNITGFEAPHLRLNDQHNLTIKTHHSRTKKDYAFLVKDIFETLRDTIDKRTNLFKDDEEKQRFLDAINVAQEYMTRLEVKYITQQAESRAHHPAPT